jgi:hypothetical protein
VINHIILIVFILLKRDPPPLKGIIKGECLIVKELLRVFLIFIFEKLKFFGFFISNYFLLRRIFSLILEEKSFSRRFLVLESSRVEVGRYLIMFSPRPPARCSPSSFLMPVGVLIGLKKGMCIFLEIL